MKKIKIKLSRDVYKKNGQGTNKKTGQSFTWTKCGLCDENGVWYNFFADASNEHLQDLKAGDEVEITYKEDEKYGNTVITKDKEQLTDRIARIEARLSAVERYIEGSGGHLTYEKNTAEANSDAPEEKYDPNRVAEEQADEPDVEIPF